MFLDWLPDFFSIAKTKRCPRVMKKVCVIGGGPAGLYTASFLLSKNIKTTLHEKEGEVGGLYRYSLLPASKLSPFAKMLKDKNFDLNLNSAVDFKRLKEMENDFDAFVIATGATDVRKLTVSGSEHCIDGLELVKSWFGSRDGYTLGKKILVIGMGNVSMDIAKFLLGWESPLFRFSSEARKKAADVTDVTICSRSGIRSSSFTNPELRTVLEIPNLGFHWEEDKTPLSPESKDTGRKGILGWIMSWKGLNNSVKGKELHLQSCDDKAAEGTESSRKEGKWWERRKRLFELVKTGAKNLRLLFNTDVKSIARCGDKYKIELIRNGTSREEYFDSVISSIGFDLVKTNGLSIKKPVYYVGWARHPRGNIETAKADAHDVASMITEEASLTSQPLWSTTGS